MKINPRGFTIAVLFAANAAYGIQAIREHRRAGIPAITEGRGALQFRGISGTDLEYAVNTPDTLLRKGSTFYRFRDGCWLHGLSAQGPFTPVADVPAELLSGLH